jgi:Lrp/AsnC family transcriptional regulator of ectoine degradation
LLTDELGIEKYFTYIVTKVVKSMPEGLPAWVDDAVAGSD